MDYTGSTGNRKKRTFISFDFDNDQFLRDAIVGQAKYEGSPFEISDWSVKQPFPESNWENKVYERIKQCELVIVMVGENTYNCDGVLKEIQMAKRASVPHFGIHGYAQKYCQVPWGLDKVYRWSWDNLKLLIDGAR